MNYPREIVPNPLYKSILCDISEYSLYRFFEHTEGSEITDADTKNIQQKYIANPTQHITDCSTVFFDIYGIKHIGISLTSEGNKLYSHYCNPDDDIPVPIFPDHFEIKDNRSCFYLNIGSIHNHEFEYQFSGATYKCRCIAVHTPMKWNYWHFSIRWIVGHNNEYLHDQDKGHFSKKNHWCRLLSSTARSIITHNAKLHQPPILLIPQTCYSKPNLKPIKDSYSFVKIISFYFNIFKRGVIGFLKKRCNFLSVNLH